ncbi:MAG: SUMF1/EgtB/PvdO family nonheme iron enzyme, partial [Tannerellaceae bacterium]
MKKVILLLVALVLFTSCGKSLIGGGGGEVTGVRTVAFNEPSPYGMSLIKRGAFEMGPSDKDSLWGMIPETKGVSFDAFWMDETEVTNAKYRQFVYWVRDSIIRERLADPAYGGNDLFKITEDRYGEPVTPHLDWTRPIPWKRANEDEIRAIESVYYVHPITGEKRLDEKQMNYRYEWYDFTAAAQRKNNLDPAGRNRNTDLKVNPNEVVMISKD